MKKITHPFQIPKIIRTAFIFVFMFCLSPSFSQVNLHDCNFHCTSNNFTLNDVFLSATNTPGSVPLSNTTCTPGTTSTAYIMLNYTSNSSSDIHFVRLNSDLIINGVHNFVNVDLGTVNGGGGQVQLYGPFTYVCGHELALQNTVIAWKTNENNDPGDNYTCDDYSSAQCDFSPNTIISKPFAVQFTYKACTIGTVTTVSFTSSTLGGVAPYVFDWDFDGDGITDSTDANPIHVYNGTGNSATLEATDAQLLFNSQTQTIVNPEELVLSAVTTNVGCGSSASGAIDLTVVGGTPPFTYAWSTSATTQDVSGLTAGDYNVVVTDSNNCQKTLYKTIANGDSDNPIVTAPTEITYEGCTTSALVANNLPAFSLTETPISLAVFNQIGGSYTDASAISSITYQDGQSGSCPISVTRTFRVKDICDNVGSANQTIFIDDTTLPTASNPAPIVLTGYNGTFPSPDITVVIDEADNCSTPVVAFVSDGTPILNGCTETTVRTYSVTDACLNTINVTQNLVRSFDSTPPIAPMLVNVTGQCSATATAPTTTDNCLGTITGTTSDPLTYNTQGTYTIHWTFDDGNGNTTQVNQSVIVDDTTPPIAPMLVNVTGQCSATATAPTTTDNCLGTITGTTTDPLTYNTQGTFTIHWTFDDGNGNTTQVNQSVIVDDTTPPIAPMLVNVTGQCSATATAPTTTDNCLGTITGTTTDPLTYNTQGTFTIHWTFDDGNGNTTQVNQSVIVDDTTPPVAPMLSNVTGQCTATATAPTTTDNCLGTITGTTSDPLTYNSQGTFTIHWTFDDGNGNTTQVNQSVIVDDTTPPEAPMLVNVTGQCSATATAPTTTDNCLGTITGTTSDPLTYNSQGTYTIHWTFDDGNGNTTTTNQSVIVDDTTPPVAPMLVNVTGQCSATATAPTTTDNCLGTITGTTSDPLTYNSQGTFTIHWTFDDGNGNTTQVNQNVIVDDTTPPVAPMLTNVTGQCSATATAPTTTDNCLGTITGTTSDPLTYYTQGTFTIHWTFDDGNGNTTQVNQSVIVDDTTPPVAPMLTNVTGQCSATATAPTTTDNCLGTITGTTSDPLTYNTQGTYTIHWTFDDGNGNTTQVNQSVIVDDTTPPVAPMLSNVTGQCSATATAPTTTDNCLGAITGTTSDPLTYNTQGTFTIHWTFDDGNGNTTQVNQSVIVDDTIAPVAPMLEDMSELCSITLDVPTAIDECSGIITATTDDPITYLSSGSYVVHWTFDDGHGNSTTVNQNVNVTQDSIVVHNAFSPNDDGLNEFFNIENIENTLCFPTNSVEIYNRWGVLVYETDQYDNYSRVFKGVSEGRVTIDRAVELPTGTYFYIINYSTSKGEFLNKKGYVYLSK
ncbi:MAG: gliding motility-associated C-terminal domain-containing protein [Flavobacterium sp.]